MPTADMANREAGAPVPKDEIDPDLVKLERTRSKIGLITAFGVVVLCIAFLLRLGPDRAFAGEGDPTPTTIADIAAGKHSTDELVTFDAEPVYAHAIRIVKTKGDLGARLVPARGTNDRVWLALQGDPWDPPTTTSRYVGRLRKVSDVNFNDAIRAFSTANARPVFAPPAAIRAGFANNSIQTVTGETVTVADGDRVAFELAESNRAILVVSLGGLRPNARAWSAAFQSAGMTVTELPARDIDASLSQVRFMVALPTSEVAKKLVDGDFWGVRMEKVTTRYETTWGALEKSPAGGFTATSSATPESPAQQTTIPEAAIDLVGVYARHEIPDDAYAVLTTERPGDYWYVMPITVILVGLALLFAWAFVRAIRRDLLPARA